MRLCGPLADDATAQVLNTLLKGLLCWIFFNITLVMVTPLYAVHKAGSLAICIFAGLTFAAALVLLHRGLLRSASLLYLSGLWLPATITIVWNGGIHGVTMVFYIALPISAAWLLGYRAALISAAVCLCSALMMAVVEQNGVRLPRYIPGTPIATWATILAAMIIAAVPVAQVLKILKEALAQSESAREAFRESEERFRNMADTAPVMIWVTDPDKGFTFFNKTWLNFTGRTLDQELGNGWAEGVHPEDLERCFTSLSSSFDARQDFHAECRLRRGDGEYRWVLCTGVPRFARGGVFAGYIGSDIDITDQKRAEATLRQSLDEIAHLNRVAAMGELTASIAHELNQPLAAILSNAQAANRFLNGESPDLADVRACLTDIVADDKRAGEVIKRLRSLLKKDQFQASVVDLNEVVGDVIRLIRNDALLRGASVAFEPCPGLRPVLGDRIQLYQVVLNLTVNGLEASAEQPSGARRLSLRTAESDGGGVLLTVWDSGKGIPNSDLARVFEPFFTTKQEGLGVGLSISRAIVQAHGGRIWAENSAGSGAIFQCVLPAAQQATAASTR